MRMVQNQTKTAGIAVSQVLEQKIDIDDASFSELRFETQPAGGDVPLNAWDALFSKSKVVVGMVRNSSAICFLSEREHEKMYGKEKAKHEKHYETGCPRSGAGFTACISICRRIQRSRRISHL